MGMLSGLRQYGGVRPQSVFSSQGSGVTPLPPLHRTAEVQPLPAAYPPEVKSLPAAYPPSVTPLPPVEFPGSGAPRPLPPVDSSQPQVRLASLLEPPEPPPITIPDPNAAPIVGQTDASGDRYVTDIDLPDAVSPPPVRYFPPSGQEKDFPDVPESYPDYLKEQPKPRMPEPPPVFPLLPREGQKGILGRLGNYRRDMRQYYFDTGELPRQISPAGTMPEQRSEYERPRTAAYVPVPGRRYV